MKHIKFVLFLLPFLGSFVLMTEDCIWGPSRFVRMASGLTVVMSFITYYCISLIEGLQKKKAQRLVWVLKFHLIKVALYVTLWILWNIVLGFVILHWYGSPQDIQ